MMEFEIRAPYEALCFVADECRAWQPAKTIFVFAPESYAKSISRLRIFAQQSGWMDAAQRDAAVLVLPTACNGWEEKELSLIPTLYNQVCKNAIISVPGEELRSVWCWETLIFAAGYQSGAVFAGNSAVAHPNYFAGVAMIDGVPDDYSLAETPSDHWLVPTVSSGYAKRNCDIPVAVWMIGEEDTQAAQTYFKQSSTSEDQVTIMKGQHPCSSELTDMLMQEFSTRIRWKNSPDGTPARCLSKEQFYTSDEYIQDQVTVNGIDYDFFTRFPKGVAGRENMPVMFSLHGHGEPAWLFCTKNGWDILSDETEEFILVLPDSPKNGWDAQRDEEVVGAIIQKLWEKYRIDRSRVYLTGFSNGAMATSWYGTKHPELFAAISPWNCMLPGYIDKVVSGGWELPVFSINGDNDHKIAQFRRFQDDTLAQYIRANGGAPRLAQMKKPLKYKCDAVWTGKTHYTAAQGYTQGERLTTYVFNNLCGSPRVCHTEIKDMPHGAIADEARAFWSFARRFSRPEGSKKVVDSVPNDLGDALRIVPAWHGDEQIAIYVPTSANSYTPARSIIILPQSPIAASEKSIRNFLITSGWAKQANKDGSVLLIPMVPSWKGMDADLIVRTYMAGWSKTQSREIDNYASKPGSSVPENKLGNVWMWEVLWNLVGYGDGADFAGDCAVAHPNRFASVTLIGGTAHDFSAGENPSDYFHVSKYGKNPDRMIGISADYDLRMKDLPSAVWMVGEKYRLAEMETAADYFKTCDEIDPAAPAQNVIFADMPTKVYANLLEPAQRILISEGTGTHLTPQVLMDVWIGSSIRWKNSPDGTLKTFYWQDQVSRGETPYIRETFRVPGEDRDREYYMYIPKNVREHAPVVLSIHGHGEPAWMFISKNGWPQVADKEGIIIVSPQDNGENRWIDELDSHTFQYLIEDIAWKYDVDRTRIYISGFSNGNQQCFNTATRYPGLFAAMFPMSNAAGSDAQIARLVENGLEIPFFGVTGDNDGWVLETPASASSPVCKTVKAVMGLAGIEIQPAQNPDPLYWQQDETRGPDYYAEKYGFRNADRFLSWVFRNQQGKERMIVTVMKNMPHGTVCEESVVAWDFMKQFRRLPDGTIVDIPESEQ